MTQNLPRVVALLATHNSARHLPRTLDSLRNQTCPNFHILISDDASTDNTANLCEELAKTDARFRVINQNKRLGWTGNINALLKEAKGDCFFFMPHDDLIKPDYVEKLTTALKNNPDAIIAYSDLDCHIDGEFDAMQSYRELDGVKNRAQRARLWLDQPTSGWCLPYRGLFRAAAVKQIKGLRKNLAGEFGADWAWILHMTLLGEFARVPEVLYQRNRGTQSLSAKWKHGKRQWLAVTLACGSEVWRSNISFSEKCQLQFYVIHTCLKVLKNKFRY